MITAIAGGNSISLTGGTLPASGSCTFSVNLTGTTSGTKVNLTNPVTSNESGSGSPASASITVTAAAAPTISKAFGATTIPLNGTTSLSFALANPNPSTSLTGVSFVDNLPAGLVVATPNAAHSNCASGTVIARSGSSTISLFGVTLLAGRSCTVSVNVTGTTTGTKVNTSLPVTSVESGPGPTASATITVGILPVTGSRSSTYVTIALTMIGLGTALLTISHRLVRRRRDTA